MNAAIRNSQAQYQHVQHQVELASAQFRSNSRFFVQPSGQDSWSVIGADDNRLYGQRKRYFDAVNYAESLERAVAAKSLPVVGSKPAGEAVVRWASLLALAVIIVAAVTKV